MIEAVDNYCSDLPNSALNRLGILPLESQLMVIC